ncbi:hypothetical protein NE237_025741 [Protea cynaroides]|uniref:Uncharacterized protein n=1 Tax=Protea cynaroides TaxID=273540 RepID=A0A9Q0H5Q9_9MAGN|nr:hypothetical protein NE237_025741 [Protea cynaroides]
MPRKRWLPGMDISLERSTSVPLSQLCQIGQNRLRAQVKLMIGEQSRTWLKEYRQQWKYPQTEESPLYFWYCQLMRKSPLATVLLVHSAILYTTLERIPEKRYAFRTPSPYCFGPTAEYSFLKGISGHSIKSFGPLMGQRRCQALKGFPSNINFSLASPSELRSEHFISVIFIPLLWEQENTKIESIGDKPLNSSVTVTPKLMLFHRQKRNSPQRKTLNLKSTFPLGLPVFMKGTALALPYLQHKKGHRNYSTGECLGAAPLGSVPIREDPSHSTGSVASSGTEKGLFSCSSLPNSFLLLLLRSSRAHKTEVVSSDQSNSDYSTKEGTTTGRLTALKGEKTPSYDLP